MHASWSVVFPSLFDDWMQDDHNLRCLSSFRNILTYDKAHDIIYIVPVVTLVIMNGLYRTFLSPLLSCMFHTTLCESYNNIRKRQHDQNLILINVQSPTGEEVDPM